MMKPSLGAMCAAVLLTGTLAYAEPLKTPTLIDLWPGGVGPESEHSPGLFNAVWSVLLGPLCHTFEAMCGV